jgi:uncharacterized Zn finger protein
MPTTKYTKKHSKDRGSADQNRKVVIVDPAYNNEIAYYHCDSCSLNIGVRLSNRPQQEEVICSRCGTVIAIQKTRKVSKLETPHKNTETLISTTPLPGQKDVAIKHEPNLQWGAKALSSRGTIKFTSYSEG